MKNNNMKVIISIMFSLIFCLIAATAAEAGCVNVVDDLIITESTTLCENIFYVTDSNADGIIKIKSNNVVLDCNNSAIIGEDIGQGIVIDGVTGVTIKNCTVSNFGIGYNISYSNNNMIENSLAIYNDKGFRMQYSDNNLLKNNYALNNNQQGVYLYNSDENIFKNFLLMDNVEQGIRFTTYSTDNKVVDSEISGSGSSYSDVYTSLSDINTFLNTTFETSDLTSTSSIIVQWYLDVYVNNTFGNPVASADISGYNNTGNLAFSALTGSNGYITRQNLTEYIQNETAKKYQTNYDIVISKSGYPTQHRSIALTQSESLVITLDNVAPAITNEARSPSIIHNDNNVIVNATITDANTLSKVWISGNWEGTYKNFTYSDNIGDTYYFTIPSADLSNQEVVSYKWYANDSFGNLAQGLSNFFAISNRNPQFNINILDQLFNEDTIYDSWNLNDYFSDPDGDNLTFSSTANSNITVSINQTTGVVSLIPKANFTGIASIMFTATDSFGAQNTSNQVTLNVINFNDAPSVTSTPNINAIEAIEYTYDVEAHDIDSAQNFSFTLVSPPSGMSINNETGLIKWAPTNAQVGTQEVIVIVKDVEGEPATQQFIINTIPILDITNIKVNGQNHNDNDTITGIAPGSVLNVEYKILNRFPSDSDKAIVGISSQGTIPEFPDTKITSGFNLEGQQTKTINYNYNVPYDISYLQFNLQLSADGKDLYDIEHESSKQLYFTIDRDFHRLQITQKQWSKNNLTCDKTTSLTVQLTNTGNWSEEGTVNIYNAKTNTNRIEVFSLPPANMTNITFNNINAEKADSSETFNITVKFRDDYYSIPDSIILTTYDCFNLAAFQSAIIVEEDIMPLWKINVTHYTYGDFSGVTYEIESQSNASLINCSILNQIFSCGSPAANSDGISKINMSLKAGSTENYEIFDVLVAPSNDAPYLEHSLPDVAFDEDTFNDSINLNDYFKDSDGGPLSYSYVKNDSNVIIAITGGNVKVSATENWYGTAKVTFNASDGHSNIGDEILVTVDKQWDDAPHISSYYPIVNNPKIAEDIGAQQKFNITINDPDGYNPTIKWYVNSVEDGNETSYTFNSNNTAGDYIIKVNMTGSDDSRTWTLKASDVPISTLYTGTIITFSQSQLANATDVTIISQFGSIDFGDQIIDLSKVVDLDSFVNINNGIIGIDSNAFGFDVFKNKNAKITMNNVVMTEPLKIYYNAGFSASGSAECPSSICTNLNYNSSTKILSFEVTGFSMYFIGNRAPVANAGSDNNYLQDEIATLDGSGSYDPDGDSLSYLWTQVSNTSVSLSSATSQKPTFRTSIPGVYVFRLVVSDGTITSIPDEVSITIKEPPKLDIDKLDVVIDGKSNKNLIDGDSIGKDASPGSSIEFKIKLINNYDEDVEDMQINNIKVKATIENIDNGDDIEEEADEFDLDAGKTQTVTLNMKVPLDVDSGEFNVIIDAEGEDENDTTQKLTWELKLNVDKEKHEIRINTLDLSPEEVSCGETADLSISIVNSGEEDEDEVVLEVVNSDLGIDINEKEISLNEGSDDNTYEKTVSINVPEDISPGTYSIVVATYYDTTRLSDRQTVSLVIGDCSESQQQEEETIEEDQKETVLVNVIKQSPSIPPQVKQTPATVISFRDSDSYIIVLLSLIFTATILMVLLLGALVVQKNRK